MNVLLHNSVIRFQPRFGRLATGSHQRKQACVAETLAFQYDLALNGYEIAGGSIRTHQPEILEKVFELLGHSKKDIEDKFGHLLKAFQYGVPPHGGIAWGLDRFLMILAKEESIREVIAFPKTGDGRDLMMQAPSEITKEQLKELSLKIEKSKKSSI